MILDIKPISSLGQGDNYINVKDNKYLYQIDKSIKVNVNNDSYILDTALNSNIEINVKEGSNLKYYILNSKSSNRLFNIKGNVEIIEIQFDESNEKFIANLNLENSNLEYKILSILDNKNSLFDLNVYHNEKYTFSNIQNIGVAQNNSNVTFNVTGKILKGMMKSKCSQKTRGIVMDDFSKVIAKPILLIDEYDCFANHGAAIGKVNDEELFYLMSRGLTKDESVLLILSGLVNPFVSEIPNESLKKDISNNLNSLF